MADQTTRRSQNNQKKTKVKRTTNRKPWKVWGFRILMLLCLAVAAMLGAIAWQFWIPESVETYVQRLDKRPLLEESVLANANAQLATLGNVSVQQEGPVFMFTVEVSPEEDAQTAKDLSWSAIQTFVNTIGSNGSEEQPFGDTFLTYEAQIIVKQTGTITPEDQILKDPNNEEGDVAFPIFGVVNHVQSQTIIWTNNN